MDDQYWITIGDEQRGPYTISQLRSMWQSGTITANTLYWQQGFDDWFSLSTIIDLLEPHQPAAPPALPPEPQIIYTPAPQPQQQTSGCTWIIIIALGIVGGIVLLSIG
ncbi:DUF4339 domain-containing protein [bacterium]|jgi:hypothetical protein|nr:DUF4339 domain-containing protein [bacterium]MDC3255440.1 DUF4339 domain-containing protein [bacterium]MDF1789730.1 DUF4339 domain-containing protein [Verrucomicrobiales bacterium]|tara:strand:+ start:496 stop:819 length:324 start_codon:yes stop_codon:yes gene_type:complete